MDDDRVARPHALDGGAHRLDPARVLVAERVRELDVHLLLPDPLDDVEVGAAQPGSADPHDHIVVSREVRLGDGVQL